MSDAGKKALLLALGAAFPLGAAAVALGPRLFPRERVPAREALRSLGAPGRAIEVGGRQVHVVERGEGPPVLLLHGYFFHTALWRRTIDALAPRFRCVAVDLFGFGWSERPRAPEEARYGYDLWTEQVLGVMDALSIERAHMVGQSLGGATILSVGARAPGRVGDVALLCPAGIPNPLGKGGGLFTWPWLGEFLSSLPGTFAARSILRDAFFHDPAAVTDDLVAEVARPTAILGTAAALLWIARNVDLGGIEERVRAFGALGKRAMVVWGREDRAIPCGNARRFAEILRPERTLVVERAGHVPNLEGAGVDAAVADFLLSSRGA